MLRHAHLVLVEGGAGAGDGSVRSVYLCLQGRLTSREQALHAQLYSEAQLCGAAPEYPSQALCASCNATALYCSELSARLGSMLGGMYNSHQHKDITVVYWSS